MLDPICDSSTVFFVPVRSNNIGTEASSLAGTVGVGVIGIMVVPVLCITYITFDSSILSVSRGIVRLLSQYIYDTVKEKYVRRTHSNVESGTMGI